MKKGQISNLLRKVRLLYTLDFIRFHVERFKNRKINREFKAKHPELKLPPDYLLYESFQINYQKYYTDSKDTANWLVDLFKKHIDINNKRVLDWGCGPARVIRHLPGAMGEDCEFFGTDYNRKSIEWCTANIEGVNFNLNPLEAKLPYDDNSLDIIYGISIFTHLSEQMHYNWFSELYRVLKPNGIMLLTTQGDNFKVKLTDQEIEQYNNDNLVVRGKVKEGHRTFSAFHPGGFMRHLFRDTDILEHIENKPETDKWLPQDIWVIRKR